MDVNSSFSITYDSTASPAQDCVTGVPPKHRRAQSWADVMEMRVQSWVLDQLIAEKSLTIISGAPKAGKSALALSIAYQLAKGEAEIHGHRAKLGQKVFYIALEGQHDLRARMRLLDQRHGPAPAFKLWDHGVSLVAPFGSDASDLIAEIKAHGATVVILDTVAASIGGGDENSLTTMGGLISTLRRIIEETGASILAIHHDRESRRGDGAENLRGHSSLRAAADTIARVEKMRSGIRTVTVLEGRAQNGCNWRAFVPIIADVGHDSDGDEVFAMAIQDVEWPAAAPAPARRVEAVSSNASQPDTKKFKPEVLDAIRRAVKMDDLEPDEISPIAAGSVGAERATINAELAKLWTGKPKETIRTYTKRALTKAADQGFIVKDAEYRVWLPPSSGDT